eukprot:TRINITY_DN68030_c9_g2_i3.p1 TRINITY_DN68030_c9_g2~~TRINITY_DN68030_c9_g2_i3.p1  ORF type:complete len:622 (-),score=47.99 TRINITY_DN68030_c9_g2_i3:289-2154(-)
MVLISLGRSLAVAGVCIIVTMVVMVRKDLHQNKISTAELIAQSEPKLRTFRTVQATVNDDRFPNSKFEMDVRSRRPQRTRSERDVEFFAEDGTNQLRQTMTTEANQQQKRWAVNPQRTAVANAATRVRLGPEDAMPEKLAQFVKNSRDTPEAEHIDFRRELPHIVLHPQCTAKVTPQFAVYEKVPTYIVRLHIRAALTITEDRFVELMKGREPDIFYSAQRAWYNAGHRRSPMIILCGPSERNPLWLPESASFKSLPRTKTNKRLLIAGVKGIVKLNNKVYWVKLMQNWLAAQGCQSTARGGRSVVLPETLVLSSNHKECQSQLREFAKTYPHDDRTWLFKHPDKHQGKGVTFAGTISSISDSANTHCVAHNGSLLQEGLKSFKVNGRILSIRCMMHIVSTTPWVVMALRGVVQLAPMDAQMSNYQQSAGQSGHLTDDQVKEFTMWVDGFVDYIAKQGLMTKEEAWNHFDKQLHDKLQALFLSFKDTLTPHQGTWQTIAVDMMVDENLEFFVIDVNVNFESSYVKKYVPARAADFVWNFQVQGDGLGCELTYGQCLEQDKDGWVGHHGHVWSMLWDERWGVEWADWDRPPCVSQCTPSCAHPDKPNCVDTSTLDHQGNFPC